MSNSQDLFCLKNLGKIFFSFFSHLREHIMSTIMVMNLYPLSCIEKQIMFYYSVFKCKFPCVLSRKLLWIFYFYMPSYNIKMAQHLLSGNYVVASVYVAVCFLDAFWDITHSLFWLPERSCVKYTYQTMELYIWFERKLFILPFFKLENNCFTMLWWFLQYISAN